ncbi:hypothetical protein L202_00363 [Cryptococcus amylolentus CBS 6039]|uniref:FAD/NAD(P)-binding domain-containing protein n=1 Tax=Cryptococcus amylolentus CBS 6039 TaxID=1295533 RepID=A0A1E3I7D4_9TREE|nr:hypothetical protein L202_00363 [Cryptococcus amylolentus CBS 6039]ODN84408.1 hypothetical protein L202_00363 [Cryptococcus amylolentus CBS 6039]
MTHQDYNNIIIVGASIGGHTLANQLYPGLPADYRILLVEALEFAFWPIAAFRAATVPGWENKITVPLTHDRVFPAGSQHQVLAPNKLMECKASSVVLQHPFEGSTEVPFWRCVIATGTTQQQPMVPDLSSTEEEYKQLLRQNQKELREVRDVVIIGGGAVGIEFAGDIRCINSKANITIIHPRSGLLEPTPLNPVPASTTAVPSYSSPPVDPRFSHTLEGHCLKLDISLIFQDRVAIPTPEDADSTDEGEWKGEYGKQHGTKEVRLKSGKRVKADYVILAAGTSPNSAMIGKEDGGALDGKLIRVDEYLKVSSINEGSIFNGQYYAIGDVCNAPGFKVARGAYVGAFSAAANIKAEIKGKSLTKFSPGVQGLGIPVGHDEGAGMVTLPWIGNWVFGSTLIRLQRGKTLGTPRHFAGSFQGPTKVHIEFDDV